MVCKRHFPPSRRLRPGVGKAVQVPQHQARVPYPIVIYLIESIVGRAIQGLEAAGTLSGSVLVINYVAQPKRRPVLIGSWMGVFMVSTILGPVIGGALTSRISWRSCFWINLPLGGPIIIILLFFLRVPKHVKPAPAT